MKKINLNITITWRYFLINMLLTSITLIVVIFFIYKEIKTHHINFLKEDLLNQSRLVNVNINENINNEQFSIIDSLVKELGNKANIRITVIREDGLIIGDSKENPQTMENHKNRPEIFQALNSDHGMAIRYSNTMEEDMLYVAIPIFKDGKIWGTIRVSSFISDIDKNLWKLYNKIIIITIIFLFIIFIVSIFFSRALSKPIKQLTNAAEEIKKGNFKIRIFYKRNDEIGQLSKSLNETARNLQNMFDNLNDEKDKLSTILSSLNEGLIVLDKEGRVLIINNNIFNIFNIKKDKILGKFYWETLNNYDFDDFVKKIEGEEKIKEMTINNRTYLVNYTLSKNFIYRIFVFNDISEYKRIEKLKADFLVNATHELKTPLTSIKGFVETLEEEIDISKQNILNIIKRNVDRLNNIISDLLMLSEVDFKSKKLNKEECKLDNIINNIIHIFSKRIEEKNIKIQINNNTNKIFGDPFLIEQIFVNLIDNAIKYSKAGGNIIINSYKKEENLEISIEDDGIGIPKKSVNRIFERFFVVDRSRSKKTGGTGLGLSIVKSIVELHEGVIRVESDENNGSKFIILFPKK